VTIHSLSRDGRPAGQADTAHVPKWNPWISATLIFIFSFALYHLTRSPVLDEHDSVQFAMGVREFNIWQHQPHPPGYPLFIFLGWMGAKCCGADPADSLHFVSAAGGALFMAAWFLIIRRQFRENFAWWVTACLLVTPAVWMTATKVLTDSLAAGLISAEILAGLYLLQSGRRIHLLATSLLGAAAAGARPQLLPVVLALLITVLWQRRANWRAWVLAFATLVSGCLLWLLPMCYLQWRLHPEVSPWLVYPRLVYGQWRWRLDKPGTYLGAGDGSLRYLGNRFVSHFLAWFGLGFGFLQSIYTMVIGIVLALIGLVSYGGRARAPDDREFWRLQRPWALVHILIIFVSLSGAQRYYLIIFPLLLVALGRGFLRLRSPWNWTALLWPALLLFIVIPLAIDNHRMEPPSRRLVRFLEQLYPPARRKDVVLLFSNVRRHAEWYAPGFVTFRDLPTPEEIPGAVAGASAIYTDDCRVKLPPGWHRIPLAAFGRSSLIYMKHHFLELYLVERSGH
jgi:hypothetical protein